MKLAFAMMAALLLAPVVSAKLMYRPEPMEKKAPESKEVVKPMCKHPGASHHLAGGTLEYTWKDSMDQSVEENCDQVYSDTEKSGCTTYTHTANSKTYKATEICYECGKCEYNAESGRAFIKNVEWMEPKSMIVTKGQENKLEVKVTFNEEVTVAGESKPTLTVSTGATSITLTYEESKSDETTLYFSMTVPAAKSWSEGDEISIGASISGTINDKGQSHSADLAIASSFSDAAGKVTVRASSNTEYSADETMLDAPPTTVPDETTAAAGTQP